MNQDRDDTMKHSTIVSSMTAGWTVMQGARLDGTPYWTVCKGNAVSVHRFLTLREASKYAQILDRVENPHA